MIFWLLEVLLTSFLGSLPDSSIESSDSSIESSSLQELSGSGVDVQICFKLSVYQRLTWIILKRRLLFKTPGSVQSLHLLTHVLPLLFNNLPVQTTARAFKQSEKPSKDSQRHVESGHSNLNQLGKYTTYFFYSWLTWSSSMSKIGAEMTLLKNFARFRSEPSETNFS